MLTSQLVWMKSCSVTTTKTATIPLLKHQKEFVTDITTPVLGMVAGKGSGKTFAFAMKGIHLAQLNVGYTGILAEPTYSMIHDTLMPTMFEILDSYRIPYKYTKSPNPKLIIQFKTGVSTILLRSAENHIRQRGINAAWIGIDEIDTLNPKVAKEAFDTYTGRLRSGKVRQMFVTSTPEGYGWMYNFFVKEANESTKKLIRAKTTDNPHLPPDYVERMYATYPPNLCEAYINGEFVNLEGNSVYYNFDRTLSHTDATINDYPKHILHCGLDFNIGNCNAIIAIIDKEMPLVLDEFVAHDTADVINKLQQRYPNRKIIVYPDSSGKNRSANSPTTSIALLKDAGLELCYRNSNPRVMDRVNSVNAMFMNGRGDRRLKINTTKCRGLTENLEQQTFNTGNEPDKTSGNDHKNDALGYFIWFRFPISNGGVLYSY